MIGGDFIKFCGLLRIYELKQKALMIATKSRIQFLSQYAYKIAPGENIFVKFWLMILAQYVFRLKIEKSFTLWASS